uniref:Metallo-beta-lactamase domain-containing protein n=1 Tax=Chromera velia CCMP2878 TaxID=1169474 RepID=A0A0G4HQT4_9ALVE|mmetsp:Transcript_24495/g.48008  ORF Transcript_24495/g.48008 Transcript_24495/m.48008 type:complete len:595 (-) Transcript_24495:144-1928(-)|eukprot:Cvel_30286.t1-p1 / transcript=Cvel_30286.t1 / gene=Cvel_30286 / organism=Chromera_velia_CCMP2878 / gene_product=Alkyl/aryl-sulfatase BDS1, putative / transcript_product=Alkyl/aryl-sulfatase BDS1, putative / location=Cvel_scaffold4293:5139-6920(-) / protein_length=594 / sequence_SO=supercontig / SO=protein_coding / is_pseudo=false
MEFLENPIVTAVAACAVTAIAMLMSRNVGKKVSTRTKVSKAGQEKPNSHLCNHTKIFEEQVVKVSENVYCAVGYALANTIMIEGPKSIIIIDVAESNDAARDVMCEFRKITDKPVGGIIYTHFHADHVGGTEVFLEHAKDGKPENVPIWAHQTTGARMLQFNSIMGPIAHYRAAHQFGMYLEKPALENCGIGPRLRAGQNESVSQVVPTHVYSGKHEDIEIDGVKLRLIYAPGETDDQTVVFYENGKILFAADNFYESFPNLYAVRGVPNRDTMQWARSIDIMIETHPEIMVPSHSLPVVGGDEVNRRLVNYRDAIQFVHDQSVRHILARRHPDEISALVQLPEHLRSEEYLKEFYGTVGWSAKSVFAGYLGWFSGFEEDLWKLTPGDYADRIVKMVGSTSKVLQAAEEAYAEGDLQWALELCTYLLRHDRGDTKRAQELKIDTLCKLANTQISANGRNWYMTTVAHQAEGLEIKVSPEQRTKAVSNMPHTSMWASLQVRLKAEVVDGKKHSLCFKIKDPQSSWTLYIRNSVLHFVNKADDQADVIVDCTDESLRRLMANPASIAGSWVTGKFRFEKGSMASFAAFFSNFERGL